MWLKSWLVKGADCRKRGEGGVLFLGVFNLRPMIMKVAKELTP